jgi:hypothetical protein
MSFGEGRLSHLLPASLEPARVLLILSRRFGRGFHVRLGRAALKRFDSELNRFESPMPCEVLAHGVARAREILPQDGFQYVDMGRHDVIENHPVVRTKGEHPGILGFRVPVVKSELVRGKRSILNPK